MIQTGRHAARAVAWKLCESKNQTPFVALDFRLSETGETIMWRGFLTEKTLARTVQSLRYCGWEGNMLTDLSTALRNEVSIVVEHEEYDGKTRPVVRWVNPLGGVAAMEGMSEEGAQSLSHALAARIAEVEAAAKKPTGQLPGDDGEPSPF